MSTVSTPFTGNPVPATSPRAGDPPTPSPNDPSEANVSGNPPTPEPDDPNAENPPTPEPPTDEEHAKIKHVAFLIYNSREQVAAGTVPGDKADWHVAEQIVNESLIGS